MKYSTLLYASCLSLGLLNPAFAGDSKKFHIQIPTLEATVEIDGELNENHWQHAATAKLNYETQPKENTSAPVITEAKIFATQTSIFVGFIAHDPNPKNIIANLTDRDNSWGEDSVGLKLDTFNNARLAYNFFVNPYGVQTDTIENELTGQESDAWDGIWYSAAKRIDNGYQVEIGLPLAMFNFDDSLSEQLWGLEFIRYYPRGETHRLSSVKIDRNINCQLCQIGTASGLTNITQGKGIQLTPSFVASRHSERDVNPVSDWENNTETEAGIDARWAITPSTLLNATVNPDFSQIEADAGQLDVNTTFALFYPEKRPFFLDNKEYFDTQENLLHTRNIGAPDYGLKLTSKVNNHTSALLIANDSKTNFLVPGNLGSNVATIDEESINIGGRYRYDFSEKLSVGSLLTIKQADNYHNYVLSGDVKYQPTQQDTFKIQYASSQTEYPETLYESQNCDVNDCESILRTKIDGEFNGNFYRLNYRHVVRNWDVFTHYENYSDGFRADLGFVDKIDFNKVATGGSYKWFPKDSFFNLIRVGGDWDMSHNKEGDLLERETEAFVNLEGKYQSFISFGAAVRSRVGLRTNRDSTAVTGSSTLFDETQFWFNTEFDPVSALTLKYRTSWGDAVDFSNNRLGRRLQIRPGFEWNIKDNLAMELSHNFTRLNVEGGRLFTANLTDLRLNWQFSVNSFLRLSSVYTDITRDPTLYINSDRDKKHSSLNNEILYGYKLNPLSVFYLGYSDGLISSDAVDSLTANERRLFMKVSYAWVL
ncbi:MAG: carbohydrate binding family 9 domain-containing protein [Shewanella sp.]|nr:carbohydrate binding family 9 domain-containing protein [Shewanella sp.]